MTKQDILDYFKDINEAYNNSTALESLSKMIDSLTEAKKQSAIWQEYEPVEPDYEGDPLRTWWYVCGECHTAIDTKDKYCRECGRKIKWK